MNKKIPPSYKKVTNYGDFWDVAPFTPFAIPLLFWIIGNVLKFIVIGVALVMTGVFITPELSPYNEDIYDLILIITGFICGIVLSIYMWITEVSTTYEPIRTNTRGKYK